MTPETLKTSWDFEESDEIVPGRHAVRLLGGGTRYEAYLAWDEEVHALVALKILRPDRIEDPLARAGLRGEVDMLGLVAHPVVVRAFDAVLDGPRPHVVLEYLDGPRLSTVIRRYGIVVEQLVPLALQLSSALHYLAARGIVHLDVKPRNIIMAAPPRLVDLSVARRLEDLGEIRSPVGTDAYMAPEQCDPELFSEIGPPSDVWGLGATLYEAVARALPFPMPPEGAAVPLAERFPQLRRGPAPLPKQVSPSLAELILACLERRPDDRPTAAELAAAIEPVAADLPGPRLGLFRPGGRVRIGAFHGG
jgi:eukaryotic-like serine/threonine-protein kinase